MCWLYYMFTVSLTLIFSLFLLLFFVHLIMTHNESPFSLTTVGNFVSIFSHIFFFCIKNKPFVSFSLNSSISFHQIIFSNLHCFVVIIPNALFPFAFRFALVFNRSFTVISSVNHLIRFHCKLIEFSHLKNAIAFSLTTKWSMKMKMDWRKCCHFHCWPFRLVLIKSTIFRFLLRQWLKRKNEKEWQSVVVKKMSLSFELWEQHFQTLLPRLIERKIQVLLVGSTLCKEPKERYYLKAGKSVAKWNSRE